VGPPAGRAKPEDPAAPECSRLERSCRSAQAGPREGQPHDQARDHALRANPPASSPRSPRRRASRPRCGSREFGGRRLYIGQRPSEELIDLVGGRDAWKIATRWGGEHDPIPAAKTYLHWYDVRVLRCQRDAAGKPMSHAEISRRLRLGTVRVAELLRGFDPDCAAAAEPFKVKTKEPRCHACGRHLVKKLRARAPQESAQLVLAGI
jgi:hypothetical protein